MQAFIGSRWAATLIRHLGARWMRVINLTPRPLFRSGKGPGVIRMSLGEPQNRSRRVKEKLPRSPTGIRTPDRPARNLVAKPDTELLTGKRVGV